MTRPPVEMTPLAEAIADLVSDGDTIALEGFTHLIPFAAGHEIIRSGRRNLTLVHMTPDIVYDQMMGMGCARRLVFSSDSAGNVQLWGIVGVQKEAVLCTRRVLVTVEEVVDELEPRPDRSVLPHWAIDYVSVVPNGAYPSYTLGYTERDNAFYVAWDAVSRDRKTFRRWMEEHVLSR